MKKSLKRPPSAALVKTGTARTPSPPGRSAAPVSPAPTPRPPVSPRPARRRLRVFAFDPLMQTRLETAVLNETVLEVRWEDDLAPGPVGEYLEVVDMDPASGQCYAPVHLNDPNLLALSGLTPSEANPQFHQQMVYAVAMRTIEFFERSIGRVALWAPRWRTGKGRPGESYRSSGSGYIPMRSGRPTRTTAPQKMPYFSATFWRIATGRARICRRPGVRLLVPRRGGS